MIKEKLQEIKLKPRQRKLFKVSKFLLKLILVGISVNLIIFLNPNTKSVQELFARFVELIFVSGGATVVREGIFLHIGENIYEINQDCLGWKSKALFVGLYFASTQRYKNHLKTLFSGLTVIFLANIFRVITTIYLAETGVISWEIIHDTLWRWGLSAVVLIIWGFWLTRKQGTFK